MSFKIAGSIVDMTGDGVWPEMSKLIREELVAPFFDVDWKIHDVSLPSRDNTNDAALNDAIADLVEHRAGVKGPTITPTENQAKEMGLSKKWGSPNGALRRAINGAVIMRTPLDVSILPKNAPKMSNVTIARQAVGGIYGAPNFDIPSNGNLSIIFKDENGAEHILSEKAVSKGVAMLTAESDTSIHDFAHATFKQGLAMGKSVLFCAKSTINPTYDGRFTDIMGDIFDNDYADLYAAAGIEFMAQDPDGDNLLIDGVVSKIPQGKLNNWIVALRNYDGDVVSDQVAGEHISLGMMDSTLVSADGILLADPPHGTAPDLEKFWHEDGKLMANPTAYIFAYCEAIRHKSDLNCQVEGAKIATALKKATLDTIAAGHMTGDLSGAIDGVNAITAQEFIAAINDNMKQHMEQGLEQDIPVSSIS